MKNVGQVTPYVRHYREARNVMNEQTDFRFFSQKKRKEKTITIIAGDNKTQLKTLINSAKLQ